MSFPQPKLPSSDELIDKYSVAKFLIQAKYASCGLKQARAQVKRYK